jgi:hypothetical protein
MKRLAFLLVVAAAGCGDSVPPIPSDALSVDEARRVAPRQARVHGYFFDPWDDVARICSKAHDTTCEGKSLVVVGADPYQIPELEVGCCSIGFYSKHEIVLEGRLRRGRLLVSVLSAEDQ